jgi:hypothetical protein
MKRLGSLTVFEGSKSQRTGGNEPTTSEESKTHRQKCALQNSFIHRERTALRHEEKPQTCLEHTRGSDNRHGPATSRGICQRLLGYQCSRCGGLFPEGSAVPGAHGR